MLDNPIRIFHLCYSGFPQSGVVSQLEAEYVVENSDSCTWEIAFFTHGKKQKNDLPFVYRTGLDRKSYFIGRILRYLYLRIYILKWVVKNRKKWDVTLIRYMAGDPFVFILSKAVGKYATVHHTKEIEETELNKGILRLISLFFEKTLGKRVLENSIAIIGVTEELVRYENARIACPKAGILYPNGIKVTDTITSSLPDRRNGLIKLIFVGTQDFLWNGLDIVYEALSVNALEEFELHIVGDLPKLISDERVRFHGTLDNLRLQSLYQEMDIGLGTFALHRKGMKEACSLKSREYLKYGLPVVADHSDSAFPSEFPFYLHSDFNIEKILEYAKKMRSISKNAVREASYQHIDKANWRADLENRLGKLLS